MSTTMPTTAGMSEDEWEHLALDTLAELGWTVTSGQQIAPGSGEREKWEDLHIPSRMLEALRKFNPTVPAQTCNRHSPRSSLRNPSTR